MCEDQLTAASSTLLANPGEGSPTAPLAAEHTALAPLPVVLLGVAFDSLTLREALARIEAMIVSRRPHYVVTPNVDFLVQVPRDLELQRILLDAPLVLCDGTPLVWASRLFGTPLPERVAGADVAPELIRMAARKRHHVFFLGTTEEANRRAAARLRAQFPDLRISHYSPPFRSLLELDDAEILRRIREARPDLLFVAFGCPKAEKWMAMHYRELEVPVAIGVGGTIEFLAGCIKRAPVWMQRAGLEWTYRLWQEPRRLFKRYAGDLWHFGIAIVRQWWRLKMPIAGSVPDTGTLEVHFEGSWLRVRAATRLNWQSVGRDAAQWQEVTGADRHCLLELADVILADNTGMAILVQTQRQLRRSGRHLILVSPSRAVRRALRATGLEACFEVAADTCEARALIETLWREQGGCNRRGTAGPLAWFGEVTANNAERIWEYTWRAIDRGKSATEPWNIDLAAVRFMDSTGVKLLLRAVAAARACGARLRFSGPSEPVRHALRLANLEYLLDEFA